METQFDECPLDRPLILHRLHSLSCLMPGETLTFSMSTHCVNYLDLHLLNWEFFLARFDTLALEAQLYLAQRSGDVPPAQGEHLVESFFL